ncbi:MAG: PAS domain-containing protein [Planctomycetota bacterium]|nr:PAS domain-containing protein [Planctomycetota bacterium]
MTAVHLPIDECERIAALRACRILDTPRDPDFDSLTRIATRLFNVEGASIAFMDANRLWIKSGSGHSIDEIARYMAMCVRTIRCRATVVIEDTAANPDPHDAQCVQDGKTVRFYAGTPIFLDGHAIGTFCLLNSATRTLSSDDQVALESLARQATKLLELRVAAIREEEAPEEALAITDAYAKEVRKSETYAAKLEEASKALYEDRERLNLALGSGGVATWDWNPSTDEAVFDERWISMIGESSVASNGSTWRSRLHPDDAASTLKTLEDHFAGKTPVYEATFRVRHRNGSWRWVTGRGVVIERDACGAPTRMVGTQTDITDRMEAEESLRHAADILRNMEQVARVGGWDLDLATNSLTWSEEVYRIHELPVGSPITLESAISYYTPQDRQLISTRVEQCIRDGTPWDLELQVVTAKGRQIWVRAQGTCLREGGLTRKLCGAFQDLTEQVHTRNELARVAAESRDLALIAKHTTNSVIITDSRGRTRWVNEAFTRQTGYQPGEVIGFTPGSILQGPLTAAEDRKAISEAVQRGLPFHREIVNYAKDGQPYWLRIEAMPVRNDSGQVTHFVSIATDITKERHASLLRAGQARVLEMVAADAPIEKTLEEVCRVVEAQQEFVGTRVSIMLVSGSELRTMAGPSLPRAYLDLVDHLPIGPEIGCCGAAVALCRRMVAEDTQTDPKWTPFRETARTYSLMSCWSQPILAADGSAIGTLAMYHDRTRSPDAMEISLIEEAARMAGIAVQRHHAAVDMKKLVNDLTLAREDADRKARELAQKAAEMELLRNAAEAASKSKSEFLANMSHEIRTPLTAILGYADVLGDTDQHAGDFTSETAALQRRETIATIRRAGEHLLTVVNDILDLSKIEAGRMTVEKIDTNLCELLQSVEHLMRPRAQDKGVSLEVKFDTAMPRQALTDPTRLRQILMNLIGNAIKFTEEGKVAIRISSQVRRDDLAIDFTIEDTGTGMTHEQSNRIFAAFSQADNTVTRRHGGTGLGLVICQRLARLMGGDVRLVRSVPGLGSTFMAHFLMGISHGAPMIDSLASELNDAAASCPPSNEQITGRILLAEDGIDNQRLIGYVLRRAGAHVDMADNGKIALEMIDAAEHQGRPYQLLLSDMQMPVMDGYSLARMLRQIGSTIPIVALTAHAMAEDRERCTQAGCNDYATKPIDRTKLLAVAAAWIGKEGHTQPAAKITPKPVPNAAGRTTK